ncbi:MAG TPA: fatty acid desaturase, partial [Polyangiaceae bacterium LLY-WYZ-14_1]|nr:fatty acid desaturase [Polyangiaceae bacterium LLY-WYZ-14_1]
EGCYLRLGVRQPAGSRAAKTSVVAAIPQVRITGERNILAFLAKVLRRPAYGWATPEGELYVPTRRELLGEFLRRLDVRRSRGNWQVLATWMFTIGLVPFFVAFFAFHFSWPLVVAGFFYSMVLMGSYGTVWLHRFGTHGAFRFKSKLWRFITKNLVIRVCPDEIYIVSHHVHHAKSDLPGDPYNPKAGWLYCFLADANHQPIASDLSRRDYARVCRLLERGGAPLHTYEEYLRWGTAEKPWATVLSFLGNWAFWYAAFYVIGGHALATALFGSALVWAVGIRTFNYGAHGGGKDLRRDAVDFGKRDLSINALWPGFVAGEWHNNHHLYPNSARNGFLWYQLDLPFLYIRFLAAIGAVSHVRDHTEAFFTRHYRPFREAQALSADRANAQTQGPGGAARARPRERRAART